MSADVRAAAERLKSAVDHHLEACVAKVGEQDPAVLSAYDALREAAESYDDALFDAFEEVTPFEFSSGPLFDVLEVEQPGVPVRMTVLQRRDFAVRTANDLVEAGRQVLREEGEDEGDLTAVDAFALYLDTHGLDETVAMADDLGLHWLGGATWVLDQDATDETMRNAPFSAVDESRLLVQFEEDVTAG